jgi:uncharacterized membrane protein (DUF2068 family)
MSEQKIIDLINGVELPMTRKLGRYFFFVACSIGLGIFSYIIARMFGLPREVVGSINYVVTFATFFTLRDMSKQWDFVLLLSAKANKKATGQ